MLKRKRTIKRFPKESTNNPLNDLTEKEQEFLKSTLHDLMEKEKSVVYKVLQDKVDEIKKSKGE